MAAPVRAPLLFSDADELPDATRRSARGARPRRAATPPAAPRRSRSATSPTPGRAAGDRGRTATAPRRPRRRSPSCATGSSARRPSHIVVAPLGQARLRDAGRRLGRALRRPGPLRRTATRCRRRPPRRCKRHPKSRSTCSAPPRRSPPTVVREIAKIDNRVQPRLRRGPGRQRDRPRPLRRRRASAGTSTTPATASSSPARDSPLDAAAAAPLSASGTWGPLLLTDSADTLPAALRGYLLDVKPGYTTDPTRAFYNHVWVIGDQEAIDVTQQAEIDELAELAKIGGEAVSEAENPKLLGARARGHAPRTSAPWPAPPPPTSRCRSATASAA